MSQATDLANNHRASRSFGIAGVTILLISLASVAMWGGFNDSGPTPKTWLHTAIGSDGARLDVLEARLEALESQQQSLLDRTTRILEGRRALTPAQAQVRAEAKEHSYRMKNDPAYALIEQQKRLDSLKQRFENEAVDVRWASDAISQVEDVIASAATNAGVKLYGADVKCRSNSCFISMNVDASMAYEDVVTLMTVDMAELLPSTTLVVLPEKDGTRQVNILAHAPQAQSGTRHRSAGG